MPPNLRGWTWSLVAVAGAATAAVVAYKYVTRGVRDDVEREVVSTVEMQESEDVDCEWLSEDETDEVEMEELNEQLSEQHNEQQMVAVDRGRNMLLATFGLTLMVIVTVVSLVVTWNNEDSSFVELPMFRPLMWIAVGVLTAATTEIVMCSSKTIIKT